MNPVAVLRPWKASDGRSGTRLYLWCPACDGIHGEAGSLHSVEVLGPNCWTWDGNLDAPTINPSILVTQPPSPKRCHSFVGSGRWEYLADCTHALAGQRVSLPPLPDWMLP